MFRRVKQFISAITAKISATDEVFFTDYLTVSEQKLFRQLTVSDQRHSLNVAYTAQQLAGRSPRLRLRLLIRAALLHDVGRAQYNLSTANKVLAVLLSATFPHFALHWAQSDELQSKFSFIESFHQALFIYYHHGEMGARRLQELGIELEIIQMVARHHQRIASDDVAELVLLRQADQMN
jgi:putative nucleotidyltransferase with HDIG domain